MVAARVNGIWKNAGPGCADRRPNCPRGSQRGSRDASRYSLGMTGYNRSAHPPTSREDGPDGTVRPAQPVHRSHRPARPGYRSCAGGLLLASSEYPDLSVERELFTFQRLAGDISSKLLDDDDPLYCMNVLSESLFDDFGFTATPRNTTIRGTATSTKSWPGGPASQLRWPSFTWKSGDGSRCLSSALGCPDISWSDTWRSTTCSWTRSTVASC